MRGPNAVSLLVNMRCLPAGEASTSAPANRSSGEAADLLDVAVLADRSKAFELFRKSYRKNEVIEENKLLLKEKYRQAKQLGQQVRG